MQADRRPVRHQSHRPAVGLITAVSGMPAAGGSAVVMRKTGEHREQKTREDFTLLIPVNAAAGIVMMLPGYTLMDRLRRWGLSIPDTAGWHYTIF